MFDYKMFYDFVCVIELYFFYMVDKIILQKMYK